jgi:hypothetical protein
VDLPEYTQVHERQVVIASSKLGTVLAQSRSALPSRNLAQALFAPRDRAHRGNRVPGGPVRYLALPTLVSCASAVSDPRQTPIGCSTSVFPFTFAFTSPRPAPVAARPPLPAKEPFACSPTSQIQYSGILAERHWATRTTFSPGSSSCRFLARARMFASAPPSLYVPHAFLPPKPAPFSSTPVTVKRQVLCESVERAKVHCLKRTSECQCEFDVADSLLTSGRCAFLMESRTKINYQKIGSVKLRC